MSEHDLVMYCEKCKSDQPFVMSGSESKGTCQTCGYEWIRPDFIRAHKEADKMLALEEPDLQSMVSYALFQAMYNYALLFGVEDLKGSCSATYEKIEEDIRKEGL